MDTRPPAMMQRAHDILTALEKDAPGPAIAHRRMAQALTNFQGETLDMVKQEIEAAARDEASLGEQDRAWLEGIAYAVKIIEFVQKGRPAESRPSEDALAP